MDETSNSTPFFSSEKLRKWPSKKQWTPLELKDFN